MPFPHREELPESAFRHQLLGLNLLFLLYQNRVAEFHTELERLPARDIQSNVYIRHPVSLEQVGDVGGDMGLIGGGGTWGDMGTWGDIQSNVYMGWRCGLWGDAVSYGVVLVMGCCCGLWAVAVG